MLALAAPQIKLQHSRFKPNIKSFIFTKSFLTLNKMYVREKKKNPVMHV